MLMRGEITMLPLGYDADGRKVTLYSQRLADGRNHHAIRAEARTFRDQPAELLGLTDDNLRALARVVGEGAR